MTFYSNKVMSAQTFFGTANGTSCSYFRRRFAAAVCLVKIKRVWMHGGQVVPSDLHTNTGEKFLALAADEG